METLRVTEDLAQLIEEEAANRGLSVEKFLSSAVARDRTLAAEGPLNHLDESGAARMVDVGGKAETERVAVAQGEVRMTPSTLAAIRAGNMPKGDVLGTARVAGIMAAKRTWELIPLCHQLLLTQVALDFELDEAQSRVVITATVRCRGKTGVEMEALTAVSAAALTIYDMAKALEKGMVISDIRLLEKRGGKSGVWSAQHEASSMEGEAR